MNTSSGAYELNHECASTSGLITRTRTSTQWFYHRVNTRVHMFYVDSNTFVPLKCPELALWKADVDRMTFGQLFLLFPLR